MYAEDIEQKVKDNTNFRTVLQTGVYSQIVAMSIPVGGEIGEEVHPQTDQTFYFVDGNGEAIVDGETKTVGEDDLVFVRAGSMHNFKNTGSEDLKILTIYAPPAHKDGTVHKTKEEAEVAEKKEEGY